MAPRQPPQDMDALDYIPTKDAGSLTNRQEWLQFVVIPAFGACQEYAEWAFEQLESALHSLKNRDRSAAQEHWKSLRSAFRGWENSLITLNRVVEKSDYPEFVDFLRRLRLFFMVSDDLDVRVENVGANNHLRGLDALWSRVLANASADTKEQLELLEGELLHTRLKWAIIENKYLLIQAAPDSVAVLNEQ